MEGMCALLFQDGASHGSGYAQMAAQMAAQSVLQNSGFPSQGVQSGVCLRLRLC